MTKTLYLDLLAAKPAACDLKTFAHEVFNALELNGIEERESSNYPDGHYFRVSKNGLTVVIAISDEAIEPELPYAIHAKVESSGYARAEDFLEEMFRSALMPSGFRIAQMNDYGGLEQGAEFW